MKNDYVLNHDFGYGKEPEQKELNKLALRNIDDLKVYLQNAVKELFIEKVELVVEKDRW